MLMNGDFFVLNKQVLLMTMIGDGRTRSKRSLLNTGWFPQRLLLTEGIGDFVLKACGQVAQNGLTPMLGREVSNVA